MTVDDVLTFWFGSNDVKATPPEAQSKLWWSGGDEIDADIRERFGQALIDAGNGTLDAWAATGPGRLALIILLDQLSRNIHRGKAEAFKQDARARALVVEGIANWVDQEFGIFQRVFFYMPLEHAEDIALQNRSVGLFEALAQNAPESLKEKLAFYVGFAHKHRDIIQQFGRFPHRNPILGRDHTEAEAKWLKAGGDTFGQKV